MADWRARGRVLTPEEVEARRLADVKARVAAQPLGQGAFGTGVKQGATVGFADELAGAAGAAGAMFGRARDVLTGFDGGEPLDVGGAYREARDEERKRLEEAREAEFGKTTGGQIAGSLLIPVGGAARGGATAAQATLGQSVLRGAKIGAGLGAVQGAGDAPTLADIPIGALKGGAIGTLAGGAAPVVVSALKGAAGALASPLREAGERADELRVLTTAGATGGSIAAPKVLREAGRVPGGVPEVARVLRQSGVSKGITTTGRIAKAAEAAREASGKEIGAILDSAAERGGVVNVAKLADTLRRSAAQATAGMGGVSDVARQRAAYLMRLADRVSEAAPTGQARIADVKRMATLLGEEVGEAYAAKAAGRSVTGKAEALMRARRAGEKALDETIDDLGMSSQTYRDARRLNQVSRIAQEAAETSLGRADKNNLLSLTDAAIAAGPAGPGGAILRRVVGPMSASARATGAEAAREGAIRLGRVAGTPTGAEAARIAGAVASPTIAAAGEQAPPRPSWRSRGRLVARTPEDEALAADLRRRGMDEAEIASILGVEYP